MGRSKEEIQRLAKENLDKHKDQLDDIEDPDAAEIQKTLNPSFEEQVSHLVDSLARAADKRSNITIVLYGDQDKFDFAAFFAENAEKFGLQFINIEASQFFSYTVACKQLSKLDQKTPYLIHVHNPDNCDLTSYDLYEFRHIFTEKRFLTGPETGHQQIAYKALDPKTVIVLNLLGQEENHPHNLNNNSFADEVNWFRYKK